MLTITDGQRALFDKAAASDFVTRACAFLRRHAGSDVADLSGAELDSLVETSMETAASFGVSTERGMMKWILLRIVAGPSFHVLPEVEALLRRAARPEPVLHSLVARIGALEARRRSRW